MMKCPVCIDVDLVMADRKGVEIDYCPKCRGVWLDRGELDKIIERSAEYNAPSPQSMHRPEGIRSEHQVGNSSRNAKSTRKSEKKRRSSGFGDLLGDIFDF